MAAGRAEGVPAGSSVSVLVCGDDEIRELNLRYAGLDAATDVLSFPAAAVRPGAGFAFAPGAELELGDIVLSLEHLRRQAGRAGHGLEVEAATLAIHGLLHLVGHDHADADAEA
ncbi:MAG TPA: rRNA maturation RNase YbeY, partial [Candidatus Dormibacteraeota bacterium]|nr:rRNA maturation RNase YbeY [Candidatus Dormibacteraeota bacterium]